MTHNRSQGNKKKEVAYSDAETERSTENEALEFTPKHVSASVNVKQHVGSTHNQHVNESVCKRQPTCLLNTPTNTSMHQSINNQFVDSINQLIGDCASLHRMSIQHNQHVKTCAVHWVRSIRI